MLMYNRFNYIFLVFIFREDLASCEKIQVLIDTKKIVLKALLFFINPKVLSSGYVAVETSNDKVNSSEWKSSLWIHLKLREHVEIVSNLYSNCLIYGILQNKTGLV